MFKFLRKPFIFVPFCCLAILMIVAVAASPAGWGLGKARESVPVQAKGFSATHVDSLSATVQNSLSPLEGPSAAVQNGPSGTSSGVLAQNSSNSDVILPEELLTSTVESPSAAAQSNISGTTSSALTRKSLNSQGFTGPMTSSTAGDKPAANSQVIQPVNKTESGSTVDFKNLKICNNQWGAPGNEKLTAGVFLSQNNTFGWYWDRNNPVAKPGVGGVLPIYPSVRIGGTPWEKSKSAHFPIRLGDINSLKLNLSYQYSLPPDGSYDLAYDMFLTESDQPSATPKRNAEVMIWIHQTLAPPTQNYRGEFSDGINKYKLYSYQMADGRLYHAFILHGSVSGKQYTVDAKRLLDQLDLNAGWYIPGIELGNEVINGAGKIEISQFDVDLNGNEI